MKLWISALIPRNGAELYEGVRLAVATSERECYQDLAEWLTECTTWELNEDQDDEDDDRELDPKTATREQIEDALENATDHDYIRLWKVETREWDEDETSA